METRSIDPRDSDIELRSASGSVDLVEQWSVRDILDGITDGFFAVDFDGRIIHFNRRAEEFFGIGRETTIGRIFTDALPTRGTSSFEEQIAAAIADRAPRRVEGPSVVRPGAWVELRIYPAERVVWVYFADITARKEIEEELRRSEERYRRFLEQSSEAIWRFELEVPVATGLPVEEQLDCFFSHGYLAECNDAMAKMYGLTTSDEIEGARLADLLVRENPANIAYLTAFVESGYRLEDAESFERAADGTDRIFVNNLIGIVESGRVVRAWGTQRDITEQRRAEEELRQSEERYRLAVEAAELAPWEFNVVTGEVRWSSKLEQIHGLEPGTFGGTYDDYRSDMHPDDEPHVLASVARALESDADHDVEYRIILPDGTMKWVMGRGRVVRDTDGRPLRMTGVCMDITERKLGEEQREQLFEAERAARGDAERANRIKDEFLSTLSHELRTPLNAIVGWSDLMRGGDMSAEEIATGMDVIQRNARMQAQIVEDLLDMSRIISGKMRLEIARLDLATVIDAALETVRPAADARGVRLERRIDPTAGIILGDESRLQQVIWNLLSNAVKFTPNGGRVHVLLERVDAHVRLAISDTGEGIAAEIIAQIFERFRQADSSTTRRHGGLGLGLAISKSLVELHGGTIAATSAGPGMGSTFTIDLPVTTIASRAESEIAGAALRSTGTDASTAVDLGGLRVLVIDDDDDGRDIMRRLLEENDAIVRIVASAHEAQAALDAEPADVVISDIGMPDVDGYEFVRWLRRSARAELRSIPAIALTAFARSEDRARALHAGFQMHVAKPVDAAEILAVVASVSGRITGRGG